MSESKGEFVQAGFDAWAARVGRADDAPYRLSVELTAEDFMLALTGRSLVPVSLVKVTR